MGQLLQMKSTAATAAFIYELNDVELRGSAHLLNRAAVHLDNKYYHPDGWETQGQLDAFQILSTLAQITTQHMVLRGLEPEQPTTETVQ